MLNGARLHLFIASLILAYTPTGEDKKYPEWPLTPIPDKKTDPKPTFDPIDTLPRGKLYVVQHNGEASQLLCSPSGVAAIQEFQGKVVIYGEFVDGTKEETRVYDAKQVFLVTRSQPGQFELLKVPAGKVERRLLTQRPHTNATRT